MTCFNNNYNPLCKCSCVLVCLQYSIQITDLSMRYPHNDCVYYLLVYIMFYTSVCFCIRKYNMRTENGDEELNEFLLLKLTVNIVYFIISCDRMLIICTIH